MSLPGLQPTAALEAKTGRSLRAPFFVHPECGTFSSRVPAGKGPSPKTGEATDSLQIIPSRPKPVERTPTATPGTGCRAQWTLPTVPPLGASGSQAQPRGLHRAGSQLGHLTQAPLISQGKAACQARSFKLLATSPWAAVPQAGILHPEWGPRRSLHSGCP